MQAIGSALRARATLAAGLLVAAGIALGLLAESAAAFTAYSAGSAHPRPLPWTGWHGRPIQRPHKPVDRALLSRASYPVGWSAGAVHYGTGYRRLGGSERVRDVQRRLTRLGYHTGPVDGLYGPLTRSAVQWFQIKHGLRPTGVVAATTLAALRDPKGFTHNTGGAQAKKSPSTTTSRPPGSQVTPRAPQAPTAATSHNDSPGWLLVVFIALLAAALALTLSSLLAMSRKGRKRGTGPTAAPEESGPRAPQPTEESIWQSPAPLRPRGTNGSVALGYVRGDSLASIQAHETAIEEACARNGWALGRLVRDNRLGKGRTFALPGLAYALEQLAEGGASRLVVDRLEHLARSMAELDTVLNWFDRNGAALTALDVGLDTSTPEGQTAMRTVMSVTSLEQERIAERTRRGLEAAWASRRAAVSNQPQLAARIREMRASGMTLQAIAEALNEEGVPTVRGGSRWRPSSVQSVLGYRRSGANGD